MGPKVEETAYGFGTRRLTERPEEKLYVAWKNWVPKICELKREDRRKMWLN